MRSRFPLLLFALALLLTHPASAVEPSSIDWQHWKQLPVYYEGRIMPLDSFARTMVETICGRQSPRIGLADALSEEQWKSGDYAEARKLFGPDGAARKFNASEMLLSFLVEPEKWQQVPFLIAHNEPLREKLGVPARNAKNDALWFVSPSELAESDGAQRLLDEIMESSLQARTEGAEFRLTGVNSKFDQLRIAAQTFDLLTLESVNDREVVQHVQAAADRLARIWQEAASDVEFLSQAAQMGATPSGAGSETTADSQAPPASNPLGVGAAAVRPAIESLFTVISRPDFVVRDVDPQALALVEATSQLAQQMATYERTLSRQLGASTSGAISTERVAQSVSDKPPSDLEKLRPVLRRITQLTELLAQASRETLAALYNNSEEFRLVPALNAAALDRDRDPSNTAQPWLDLQTLLTAPTVALGAYPQSELAAVRGSFQRIRETYAQREARPIEFSQALADFSKSVAKLGAAVEPVRQRLPIAHRDEALLGYTAYPPDGRTLPELRYNELDPFKWTWIVSFAALATFTAGLLVRSRAAFWLALLLLLSAMAVACYGFYLRMLITGWAPVTGMYETVIYVPLVSATVGLWFCLLPLTWQGLCAAWRMTALPGSWESRELSAEECRIVPRERWLPLQVALLLPRVGLTVLTLLVLGVWPYAAGERTIINLLPSHETGALPDFNNLLTWAVGLAMLAPAVWYLPRVVMMAAASLLTVPLSLRGRMSSAVEQVYPRAPFLLSSALVATFFWLLAWYTPVLPKEFAPLTPVLRDNFWLTIHVMTIVASYAAGALAWILGNITLAYYLLGRYRGPESASRSSAGHRPAQAAGRTAAVRRPPEICGELAGFTYKTVQLAVLLLAAGTILGGLWADVSWGRFWGWDPKEVWALISCLVYLALLHARYAGVVHNFGMAVGTVAGASAIAMSWYGVNFVLGEGLHSYGFVEGSKGQWWVLGALVANWGFVALAALRYLKETRLLSAATNTLASAATDEVLV